MPSDTVVGPTPNSQAPSDDARLSRMRDVLEEPSDPPVGRLHAVIAGLRGMDRKRAARLGAGLLALLVILWIGPVVLLLSGLLLFWIALGAVALMGPATVWARVVRRAPRLAEMLRRRADKLAIHYDAMLDRLPEHWAKSLYLPDLSQPIHHDPKADDGARNRATPFWRRMGRS